MASPIDRFRRKDYTTGYTGHVPKKRQLYGMTTGETWRLLKDNSGVDKFYKGNHIVGALRQQNNSVWYTDNNWIGGPTDKLQSQYVPGYTGHVPALKAENLFAKSYAKVTGKALRMGTKRKNNFTDKDRFYSQNSLEFNPYNFSRLIKEPELLENKDYLDYSSYVNKQLGSNKEKYIRSNSWNNNELYAVQTSNRSPFNSKIFAKSLLSQGNKIQNIRAASNISGNSDSGYKTNYGAMPNKLDVTPIKARLVESRIAEKDEFLNLPSAFQNIYTNGKFYFCRWF